VSAESAKASPFAHDRTPPRTATTPPPTHGIQKVEGSTPFSSTILRSLLESGLPKQAAPPWLNLLGSCKPERKVNVSRRLGTLRFRKIKQAFCDLFIALHGVFQWRPVDAAANQLGILERLVGD